MNRYKYNLRILIELVKVVIRWKDLRFCQILCNLGIGNEDCFNEEPNKTLERIYESKLFKDD